MSQMMNFRLLLLVSIVTFPSVLSPTASQTFETARSEHGVDGDVPRSIQRSVSVCAVRWLQTQCGASLLPAYRLRTFRPGASHLGIVWSAVSDTDMPH